MMKRRLFPLAAAGLIVTGALGDHLYGAAAAQPTSAAVRTTASSPPLSSALAIDAATEHAYAVAGPSVVYVDSAGVGSGSGVIYDSKGDIVTNAHVVRGAQSITVTLNDGRTLKASVVGTDMADDLTVIRVNASNLTPAHFASAGSYRVAQTVLAIGSPVGLKQSVTSGLISGVKRVEQEPNGAYLPDAIQTSAPINPGNSGGALVTLNGTVAGIPTLVQTTTQDGASTQGLGFAIPAERVVSMASQIISQGRVVHTDRAFLGVALGQDAGQSALPFGNASGLPNVAGATINTVAPGSPAASAGLQAGDTITAIDGATVTSDADLLSALAVQKPGAAATLSVNRQGQTIHVTVHLIELPAAK